jgi:hypothetical protein
MRAFGNNIVEREGEVRSHGHADLFLGFEIGKGGGEAKKKKKKKRFGHCER